MARRSAICPLSGRSGHAATRAAYPNPTEAGSKSGSATVCFRMGRVEPGQRAGGAYTEDLTAGVLTRPWMRDQGATKGRRAAQLPERPSSACSSSTLRGDLRTSAPGGLSPGRIRIGNLCLSACRSSCSPTRPDGQAIAADIASNSSVV
jgi:hypothetical protein